MYLDDKSDEFKKGYFTAIQESFEVIKQMSKHMLRIADLVNEYSECAKARHEEWVRGED